MTDNKILQRIDIFISSPSDVASERKIAQQVIAQLNESPFLNKHYHFRSLVYEKEVPPEMGDTPQGIVDRYMPPDQCAIVICIFWDRMGTPFTDKKTDTLYQSGTEYEFQMAYHALQEHKKPHILLYRKTQPNPIADSDQKAKVDAFFEALQSQGLYALFETTEQFEGLLSQGLNKLIAENLAPEEFKGLLSKDIEKLITQSLAQEVEGASRQRRQQSNLIIRGIGLIVIVLLLIAAAIVFSASTSGREQANRAATIAVQVALNSTATATQWTPTPSPTPRPLIHVAGKLNVIVAGFGYKRSDNSIVQDRTADDLNDLVADTVKAVPDVGQVGNHETSGVEYILDSDAQQRSEHAKTLAETMGADIVIYGLVSATENDYYNVFTPEIFIHGSYAQQEDFIGAAQFSSPVQFLKDSPDTSPGSTLQARIAVLQPFLRGLAASVGGKFSDSEKFYEDAISAANQTDSDQTLLSLLYVLAGNAVLRQGNISLTAAQEALTKNANSSSTKAVQDDLDKALQGINKALGDYDNSLAQQANYPRALIGRASGLYQWLLWQDTNARLNGNKLPLYEVSLASAKDLSCGANVSGIDILPKTLALQTLGCYQQAADSPVSTPQADVDIKVAFGKGQVYLWMAQHSYHDRCDVAESSPLWDQARNYLLIVIAKYNAADSHQQARVRYLAANAHAWLGLQLIAMNGSDKTAMQQAKDDYNQAIQLLQTDINLTYNKQAIAVYQKQLTAITNWLAISNPPTPLPCSALSF